MRRKKSTVISMARDTKIAALCADYVLPGAYMAIDEEIDQDSVMGAFLPPVYCMGGRTCAAFQSHLLSVGRTGYCLGEPFRNTRQEGEAWIKLVLGFARPLGDAVKGVFGTTGHLDYGVLLKFESRVLSFKLNGLTVVDVDKLSWEHILDFRNDEESLRHVSDLRGFLDGDRDVPHGEAVAERLQHLLDNHNNTLEKWGFPLRRGSVEYIVPLSAYPDFERVFAQPLFGASLASCRNETHTRSLDSVMLTLNACRQRDMCFHEFGHVVYLVD